MLKFLKTIASSLIIILFTTILNAEESFCIDKKGLILPLFDEVTCELTTDIKIDEEEFIHIIEFNESARLLELNNFRKNKLEIEKTKKEKLVNKSDDEIKKIEENKKKLDQKKILNLANQQEEKRIARQKELELKKQKRLAEIEKRKKDKEEKRIARQKELELKKQKRLAEIEKRKRDKEEKRIAIQKELELKKQKRLAEIKKRKKDEEEKLAKKKISDNLIVERSDVVNEELKIIYFDK